MKQSFICRLTQTIQSLQGDLAIRQQGFQATQQLLQQLENNKQQLQKMIKMLQNPIEEVIMSFST